MIFVKRWSVIQRTGAPDSGIGACSGTPSPSVPQNSEFGIGFWGVLGREFPRNSPDWLFRIPRNFPEQGFADLFNTKKAFFRNSPDWVFWPFGIPKSNFPEFPGSSVWDPREFPGIPRTGFFEFPEFPGAGVADLFDTKKAFSRNSPDWFFWPFGIPKSNFPEFPGLPFFTPPKMSPKWPSRKHRWKCTSCNRAARDSICFAVDFLWAGAPFY